MCRRAFSLRWLDRGGEAQAASARHPRRLPAKRKCLCYFECKCTSSAPVLLEPCLRWLPAVVLHLAGRLTRIQHKRIKIAHNSQRYVSCDMLLGTSETVATMLCLFTCEFACASRSELTRRLLACRSRLRFLEGAISYPILQLRGSHGSFFVCSKICDVFILRSYSTCWSSSGCFPSLGILHAISGNANLVAR